jgi:hypothetical protein
VRHGLLKNMKRKGGLGWVPAVFSPGIVTAELEFWSHLYLNGLTVYDVGAFQGLLTLFFAFAGESGGLFRAQYSKSSATYGESGIKWV